MNLNLLLVNLLILDVGNLSSVDVGYSLKNITQSLCTVYFSFTIVQAYQNEAINLLINQAIKIIVVLRI